MKKSIFITGAAKGIGKATALLFARKGYYIGLSDINENDLQKVAEEIGTENCSTYILDVRNIEQIEHALQDFGSKTHQQMNVLFNNAGVLFSGGFDKVDLEKNHLIADVNFKGVMNMTYFALPLLKKTPKSAIINMCSASSFYGNPELTAYAASKSAVKSLTEGWNMLYKKYDIHVADLIPAYVKTDMVTDEQSAMKLDDKDLKISAEEIAQVVWDAAHSNQIHFYIGTDSNLLRFSKWLLPPPIFKEILKSKIFNIAIEKN
ncbi:MAG TPA: SDR family oxidoreductase [Chitinophagales bacterium]|nr:SDR family oxidoreductase [Chitinophagales bacterium]